MNIQSKFWMNDPSNLFKSFKLIPDKNDHLEDNLNTIMRLAIFGSLAIAVVKPILGLIVLIIVAAITASSYSESIQWVETFENFDDVQEFSKEFIPSSNPSSNPCKSATYSSAHDSLCNDGVSWYSSSNELLHGPVNPKTLVAPIVPAPSHDLNSWKSNNFVVHSGINSKTVNDVYRSGYPTEFIDLKENFVDDKHDDHKHDEYKNKDYWYFRKDENEQSHNENKHEQVGIQGLPDLKSFLFETPQHDNLLTQTLQPGFFQKSYIGEPIQSNIGISHVPEFGPVGVHERMNSKTKSNNVKFTQYPEPFFQKNNQRPNIVSVERDNVYDPRLYGYGTSYRSYIDTMGRPQYFYKDIDSINMQPFVRNKTDVFPWASENISNYQQLANDSFTDATIQFRTEMQESLMRKRNSELWQQRKYPITTMRR